MKKLEKIFGILFVVGVLMKLFLFPGAELILIMSLLLLSLLYYPLGFLFFNEIPLKKVFKKEAYRGLNAWRIIGSIGVGIGLSTIIIGILFKLQYWPNADDNLQTGLIFIGVIIMIAVIRFIKNRDVFYKRIFFRIAIIGGFGLILFFVSNSSLHKFQYRNYPAYIKAYENYLQDPENEELQKKQKIELNRIIMTEEEFQHYMEQQSQQSSE